MLKVAILNPKRTIYEGEAWSVFLPGDLGEFEVLEFHRAIMSLLTKGDIIIDWTRAIPISKGIMRLRKDELVALVEE